MLTFVIVILLFLHAVGHLLAVAGAHLERVETTLSLPEGAGTGAAWRDARTLACSLALVAGGTGFLCATFALVAGLASWPALAAASVPVSLAGASRCVGTAPLLRAGIVVADVGLAALAVAVLAGAASL